MTDPENKKQKLSVYEEIKRMKVEYKQVNNDLSKHTERKDTTLTTQDENQQLRLLYKKQLQHGIRPRPTSVNGYGALFHTILFDKMNQSKTKPP